MVDKEKAKASISEEAVEAGVREGFINSVDNDFTENKVVTAIKTIGISIDVNDLDGSIDKLNRQIVRTRLAAIGVWLLCVALFISRFI